MATIPKQLFLNIQRDDQGRVWGVARICLADGSCLCVESRVYREAPGAKGSFQTLAGEERHPLDEALDKLCRLTEHPVVMHALPLPARLALKLVCKARNLQKIKRAAEEDGNDGDVEEAIGALESMRCGGDPIARRAIAAQRLWA